MNTSSVSPTFCYPVVTRKDKLDGNEIDDEVVDPKLAMMKEPIVGLESVTWEHHLKYFCCWWVLCGAAQCLLSVTLWFKFDHRFTVTGSNLTIGVVSLPAHVPSQSCYMHPVLAMCWWTLHLLVAAGVCVTPCPRVRHHKARSRRMESNKPRCARI